MKNASAEITGTRLQALSRPTMLLTVRALGLFSLLFL
jgi:hypothetical protein